MCNSEELKEQNKELLKRLDVLERYNKELRETNKKLRTTSNKLAEKLLELGGYNYERQ